MSFYISKKPIDDVLEKKNLAHDSVGGFVCFEGWVRNYNEGRLVNSLEYEAFSELCETEAFKIINEVKKKYRIINLSCVHRLGHLNIGDMAVWIGVTSEHRGEAFEACQYLIDEIKLRLPIWKKEHYASGESEWVNCQGCYSRSKEQTGDKVCSHSEQRVSSETNEKLFYSKQSILKEIGDIGQNKLKNSKVLVVGAGGLGSPVIQSLSAMGVGNIGICDFDIINISNLHRQSIYKFKDVGSYKVDMAKNFVCDLNPFIECRVYKEKIDLENIDNIADKYDYIVDCSDNFSTKFLLNDYSYSKDKVLVQGSIYQFEGQIQSFYSKNDKGCLRCIWEKQPSETCISSCVEAGVLGVIPTIIGNFQSLEVVKSILSDKMSLNNKTYIFNFQTLDFLSIKRKKNPDCILCSSDSNKVDFKKIFYTENYFEDFEIKFNHKDRFSCIDIREKNECVKSPSGYREMPLSSFDPSILDSVEKILLVCQRGLRSKAMVKKLRKDGFSNIYSLRGGLSRDI